jgi:hypothetical protein
MKLFNGQVATVQCSSMYEQDPEVFDVIDTNTDGYIQLNEFDIGT